MRMPAGCHHCRKEHPMQHISKNLPSMNGSSEQPTRQPQKYSQNSSERIEKQRQLQALITQSFDIFQVYGKEPEAVKNILHGFSLVLDHYNGQDITAAFHSWMRTASV